MEQVFFPCGMFGRSLASVAVSAVPCGFFCCSGSQSGNGILPYLANLVNQIVLYMLVWCLIWLSIWLTVPALYAYLSYIVSADVFFLVSCAW